MQDRQRHSSYSTPQRRDNSSFRQPVVNDDFDSSPQRSRRSSGESSYFDDYDSFFDDSSYPYQDNIAYDSRQNATYRQRPKKKHTALWLVVLLLSLAGIAALGLLTLPQIVSSGTNVIPKLAFVNGKIVQADVTAISNFNIYRDYMCQNVIYPGIYIDGVNVGGLTIDEARKALSSSTVSNAPSFGITVNVGNMSWNLSSDNLPVYRGTEQSLLQAYALGRQNTTSIRDKNATPFVERQGIAASLRSNPVSISSAQAYDESAVRQFTDAIVDYVNRDPVPATVKSFDFSTGAFSFTDESAGVSMDPDRLFQQVADLVRNGKGGTVTGEMQIVMPSATKAQLAESFGMISSYTTSTTSNANRNTNIDLSAQAINGTVVNPGETFSFNSATGQRTYAKGYREATAISGGQNVPEIGGGVCQTSSTLFNAVARANMDIVKRSPHAWPSSYVEKGMDATVNWPDLDFKFQNNTDWPIFIVAYYFKQNVTVEIYGKTLGQGISIDLESRVTQTIDPPSDINYVQNTFLPVGTEKETVKARTGYVVETYKIWYRDSVEFQRDLLCKSNYKAYQKTVEYN